MKFEINAEAREESGRASSRRLRRTGRVPAIIYGGGKDPAAVTLDRNSLTQQMALEAFYTSILSLKLGKRAQSVIVKEVQRHPAKSTIMHLDFQRIVEDEEITIVVPIHFLGEETAIGVKEQGGVIEHTLSEVEVSCLPANLPEFIELDVSALELNQILHLSDIAYPEGVTSTQLAHDHDQPVVAIHPPRRQETDEAGEEAAETVEGETEAAPEQADQGDSSE